MEFFYPATEEQVCEIEAVFAKDSVPGITDVRIFWDPSYMVAMESGAVIGIATLSLDIGELAKLYVIPAYKNRGIGTALVSNVIDLFQTKGFGELLVEMTEQSYPFWEKFTRNFEVTRIDDYKFSIDISATK